MDNVPSVTLVVMEEISKTSGEVPGADSRETQKLNDIGSKSHNRAKYHKHSQSKKKPFNHQQEHKR